MSKFPSHTRQAPDCLNPLNLKDLKLFFFWKHFNPKIIQYYLYKVDPRIYFFETNSETSIFNNFGVFLEYISRYKAYRNLWLLRIFYFTFKYALAYLLALFIALNILPRIPELFVFDSKEHISPILTVSISKDGQKILSSSIDGRQQKWNLKSEDIQYISAGNSDFYMQLSNRISKLSNTNQRPEDIVQNIKELLEYISQINPIVSTAISSTNEQKAFLSFLNGHSRMIRMLFAH